MLVALQSGDVTKPDVDLRDLEVGGGPAGPVPVRVIRPRGVIEPLPVILYLHAGWGFWRRNHARPSHT